MKKKPFMYKRKLHVKLKHYQHQHIEAVVEEDIEAEVVVDEDKGSPSNVIIANAMVMCRQIVGKERNKQTMQKKNQKKRR